MRTVLFSFIVLASAAADTLWLRRYDAGASEYTSGVAGNDRRLVVAGFCDDTVGLDYDWLVLWYRQSGELENATVLEIGADDYCGDVDMASDGRAIVAGYSFSLRSGRQRLPLNRYRPRRPATDEFLDGIVLKTDSAGTVVWQARVPWVQLLGIAADAAGGGVISGTVFTGSEFDLYCARFGPGGESLWARSLNFGVEDVGYRIAPDGAGGFIQAGTVLDDTVEWCQIVRWSALGETLWTRAYRRYPDACYGTGVAVDDAGNYYVAAGWGTDTTTMALLLKYSPSGELLWERTLMLGTWQWAWVDAVVVDGDVFVAGTAGGETSLNDFVIARYSPAGETLWTARWDQTDDDIVTGITVDGIGNPVVSGVSDDARQYSDCITMKYGRGSGVVEDGGSVVRAAPKTVLARGQLKLEGGSALPAGRTLLVDALGRGVLLLKPGNNDLSGVAPGVYFVRTGGLVTGRVVVLD